MINGPTVLILLGSIATIVLVAIVLVRQSQGFDTAAKTVRDELKAGREEAQQAAARQREELGASLKAGNDTLVRSLESLGTLQQVQLTGMTTQIKELTESSQRGMRQVRDLLDTRVKELQEGNERKLDEMRKTVDERCFRHQLLLPRPYLVLTKPLRLDIQCQRAASVKIGWKYLDD